MICHMNANDTFRRNLIAAIEKDQLKPATLSKRAGLNARAVTDILEERAVSPKLSTVFALAKALGKDPAEMMGLGPRPQLQSELVRFLEQYSPADQERLLAALRALPAMPHE